MNIPTCAHIKANGVLCGSPAMRRSRFCYYHDADRRQRARILQAASLRERARYAPPTAAQCRQVELIDIHTPRGIQRALDTILQSVWTGNLDSASASTMLNAINMKMRVADQCPTQESVMKELQALMAATGVSASPIK